jgi:hypothetical protein
MLSRKIDRFSELLKELSVPVLPGCSGLAETFGKINDLVVILFGRWLPNMTSHSAALR